MGAARSGAHDPLEGGARVRERGVWSIPAARAAGPRGEGEVFKAKSFGVGGFEKVLVIKRILPELARSPEFVDMFIHEAKLAVRLSHANIVQVFDLGKAPGEPGEAAAPARAGSD